MLGIHCHSHWLQQRKSIPDARLIVHRGSAQELRETLSRPFLKPARVEV